MKENWIEASFVDKFKRNNDKLFFFYPKANIFLRDF